MDGWDFSQREVSISWHINVKEAVALKNSLALFCASNLDKIKGKTVIVKVDNQVLSYIYENGGSTQQQEITRVCKRLFWLQLQAQFRLKLQWIPSGENEADGITREDVDNDIRLHRRVFATIIKKWGGIFRGLMASSGNVQLGRDGEKLPFFSRYQDTGSLGVDVFAQNIARDKGGKFPDFCFPLSMTGKFLAFAIKSRSWCVVVVPQIQASWFHLTETNRREILPLAKKGQQGKLLKF